jgi:hypothetical protein
MTATQSIEPVKGQMEGNNTSVNRHVTYWNWSSNSSNNTLVLDGGGAAYHILSDENVKLKHFESVKKMWRVREDVLRKTIIFRSAAPYLQDEAKIGYSTSISAVLLQDKLPPDETRSRNYVTGAHAPVTHCQYCQSGSSRWSAGVSPLQ